MGDGGDDVFVHWKELAVEGLHHDTEYDDRKGNW